MKRTGLRHRNAYQCRHTYASPMLTAGQNPWYVAEQIRHVDVQMVFRVYAKFIVADYQKPKAQPPSGPSPAKPKACPCVRIFVRTTCESGASKRQFGAV